MSDFPPNPEATDGVGRLSSGAGSAAQKGIERIHQTTGSCEINSNSTVTGTGKGTYTMRGDHVRCSYEYEPEYGESGRSWGDNYDILVLDQTHIQIVDRFSMYWYICALDDDNLWNNLHLAESINSFIDYTQSMSYDG